MNKENTTQNIPQILNSFKELQNVYFICTDARGVIKFHSQGMKEFLKLEDEEALGKIKIENLFENLSREEIFLKTLEYGKISVKQQINFNNISTYCVVSVSLIEESREPLFMFLLNDLNSSASRPSRDNKLFDSVKMISKLLNSTLELEETLDLVLNKLDNIIPYDLAFIMFIDGYNLNIKAFKSKTEDFKIQQKVQVNINKNLSDFIKQKNTIIIHDNIDNHPLINLLELAWAKEVIIIPLIIKESFFGLMAIANSNQNEYLTEEILVLEVFASTAAYSIKNAELSNVLRMQLRILRENVIERTKALEFIKVRNQQIIEADKMKNEFIAHMSHELRTPLNAIICYSEALKMKYFGALNERQEEYIDDIHVSGIHLLGMINDILDLSKIEANKMDLNLTEFSVELATNEVINIVIALANKKHITLEEQFYHSQDLICADYRKYQQVLYNLLSNAIKFSHEDSKIEILTKDTTLNNKNAIEVSIKDYGVGISKENQEKIFHKFQQLDSIYNKSQPGTGLGLTITKQLVEMHGGKILVDSEVQKGSTFIIIIPTENVNFKKEIPKDEDEFEDII